MASGAGWKGWSANSGPFWGKARWGRFGAILLAALMMSWPAFYNGFPLLYPDSMTYLDDGRLVARALFLHRFSAYYGIRSFIYSLGILPFHWNITPWPVAALQALLVAWLLWLTVRSIVQRNTASSYLGLVLLLSLLTSLSWYVPLILPDILGPLLYLSIYLLVFARDSLGRLERWSLYIISWWSVASHATHLMLGAGLCVMLALLALSSPATCRTRLKSIGEVALVIVLAAASQLALNGYLYGHPSLNGERPPFLTARIVADGPGRWYLERHCGEVKWVICDHLDKLSDDPDNFLWGSGGLWSNLSQQESERLMQEEMPFVLATLRAYPREQLARSAQSVWEQLGIFGLNDLDPSSWTLDQFPATLPASRASYMRGRQARNAIPLDDITSFQFWVVMATLVIILAFAPWLWRSRSEKMPKRLMGLTLVIFTVEIANAVVTSTLSMVEDRFQSRVIWLVPLLAGLVVLDWWNSRRVSLAPPKQAV